MSETSIFHTSAKDGPIAQYRGWEIALSKIKPTIIDTSPKGAGHGTESCWMYNLHAYKPKSASSKSQAVTQPLWMTRGQMEICRTPLDAEAAFAYMMDNGMRLLRKTIDMFEAGTQQPDTVADSPDTDAAPQPRVHVTPHGLQVDPPADEMPGTS